MEKKIHRIVIVILIVLIGLSIRIYLTRFGNSGDVSTNSEWGQKFWLYGSKNFYFNKNWYYSFPALPPISSLMFAGIYWIADKGYILAQIHNALRIIPSELVTYFNKIDPGSPLYFTYGYFMTMKFPAIFSDLFIGLLIYKLIFKLTSDYKKALLGLALYFLNPVTIFLSSVWGQTESLIAVFGLLAFLFAFKGKSYLAIPLFFTGLYIKPTWIIFTPLLACLIYLSKPRFKHVILGILFSFSIFLLTTLPFSKENVFSFTKEVTIKNLLPVAKGTAKASISAFNFYTIFLQIDKDLDTKTIFSVPAKMAGLLFYVVINIFSFKYLTKQNKSLYSLIISLFLVGMGSFLLLTNILERYFFAAFVPMIIILSTKVKKRLELSLLNIFVFANLFWSFYRRSWGELDFPFTSHNFLLIRIISLLSIIIYLRMIIFSDEKT